MLIDAEGYLIQARYIPSPNCDERPDRNDISLLVIHAISLPPEEFGGEGVIELFTNQLDPQAHPYYQALEGLKVSSHFFIRRNGEIIQFVPCTRRAWHAGVSCWQERTRCNDFSIGIELEGSDNQPFTPMQYTRLTELTQAIQAAYPVHDIVGHADIAPQRKTDPGPYFDWQHYRQTLEKRITHD
ncbi:1,6-anhydro-N-acetylmuramyl-L-alanine amidase AmpD [Nitrosomonas sp.]|uniref:1,6-anhydro-N-acetylmuramyl-L-alanine amidase AmpD n=1 Tax=Nitrosomonas sp. TaxID=42353 RepID=UPI0025DE0E3D|nr:1,6-anhydro-N-acetylmuramyl-L-alanine amidase AmpD [Nitrosomonas sp.]MBE7527030.1 1,6-anhydro-N-acetylmuramyl-L-alanine amidase AmpD [Burkholderiales bacterium]